VVSAPTAWTQTQQAKPEAEDQVAPAEDLMREHGVLNRILLIYDEGLRRLKDGSELNPEVLSKAAGIIHHFIEDYHEKLEEDYLFPRFEKAGKLVELVRVLRLQHQAGRRVTAEIESLTNLKAWRDADQRSRLANALRQFVQMYRPHEAREDTVLFPALRAVVSPHEYAALGEQFEDKEHELFGADGFERKVAEVAALEQQLDIYDLAQFTPRG
jgi:hemerythrin-like domain-containing protein